MSIIPSVPGGPRPTLADVARLAGCSPPTASKALSGRPEVARATRVRVAEAAESLGYQRRERRTFSPEPPRREITAGFDTFGSLYSAEVFAGALAETSRRDVRLSAAILPQLEHGGIDHAWLDEQIESGSSGAMVVTSELAPTFLRHAAARRFPVVAVDPKSRLDDTAVSIGATNWAGAARATLHLLDLGHRRIAFAGKQDSVDFALERFAGFRSTLERAGLGVDAELVFTSETDYDDGYRIGTTIAQMSHRPTGVVCVCDAVALGVIEAARRQGLRTPEDISVVGFDDITPAHWSSPALTTVHQPLHRMGALAVRTLLGMIDGDEPESHHVQLATSLVVRSSTAPARRAAEVIARPGE